MATIPKHIQLETENFLCKNEEIGGEGVPYCRPHEELENPQGVLLIKTKPLLLQTRSLIMLIHLGENLKKRSVLNRKFHGSLSKALEMSNFRQNQLPEILVLSFWRRS